MAQSVKRGLLSVACVSRRIRRLVRAFASIAAVGTGLMPAHLWAQAGSAASGSSSTDSGWATPASTQSVMVAPVPTLGAGWLKRWLLGLHYRDLWTLPLRVQLLYL